MLKVEETSYGAVRAATPSDSALVRLAAEIEELIHAFNGHEARLSTVLSGAVPTEAPEVCQDFPGNSDLVRALANHADEVAQLTARIRRLTARLEV